MGHSNPFRSAIPASRPRGVRVIEVFSPKLGRRLQCYGDHAFDQWICLESDPSVQDFCERPAFLELNGGKRLVDYWVRQHGREILLIVGDGIEARSITIGGIDYPLLTIPSAEHAAARMWISNWARILPTITSCREIMSRSLTNSVLSFVSEPMQMSRIEQEFGTGDPTLVRATVFSLLHDGRLQAPQLRTAPLSFLTHIEPAGSMP